MQTQIELNLTPTERAYLRLKYKCYKEHFILTYDILKKLYRIAMRRREFEVAAEISSWGEELYGENS